LNYEHPFPRVSGYLGVCDIMEVDITEFRVYGSCESHARTNTVPGRHGRHKIIPQKKAEK
jgi:hypothetical protein